MFVAETVAEHIIMRPEQNKIHIQFFYCFIFTNGHLIPGFLSNYKFQV